MKISGDSIVDTIINYANIKFGVEMSEEQVSAQLKELNLSSTLDLLDAIREDNNDGFLDYIDINVQEAGGYGTGASASSRDQSTMKKDQVAMRRQRNREIDAGRDATGGSRTVAGGGKTATGGSPRSADPAADQRNANTANNNRMQAELERMKQVVRKMANR